MHEHFQFHTTPQRTASTSEPWVSWQGLMSVDHTDYSVIKVRPWRKHKVPHRTYLVYSRKAYRSITRMWITIKTRNAEQPFTRRTRMERLISLRYFHNRYHELILADPVSRVKIRQENKCSIYAHPALIVCPLRQEPRALFG